MMKRSPFLYNSAKAHSTHSGNFRLVALFRPRFSPSKHSQNSNISITSLIFIIFISLIVFTQITEIRADTTEWWKEEALVGSYSDGGDPMNVVVRGNYAYMAEWNEGLEILDITNLTHPIEIAQLNVGVAVNLALSENCAFLATSNRGIQIVNISTPSQPTLLTHYDEAGNYHDIKIVGHYAYALEYYEGLQILDISDPEHPSAVGQYYGGEFGYGLDIVDSYAYLANNLAGFLVIDISDPTNPTQVGEYTTNGQEIDVTIAGHYAYVADGWKGLKILDVHDPAHILKLGEISEGELCNDIQVSGNYAFMAYVDVGVKVFDIRDPTSPFKAAQYENGGSGRGVWVDNNYLFVADAVNGLEILNLTIFHDEDGDQIPDGYEQFYQLNASDPEDALKDPDADGLSILSEYRLGFNFTNADTDGDTLPDGWEYFMGLNGSDFGDANLDKDYDGISNRQEFLLGMNASSSDSDRDGLPDGWEVTNDCDPLVNDAKQDPDWDGRSNLREYLKQSNPHQFNFIAPVFLVSMIGLFFIMVGISNHHANMVFAREIVALQHQVDNEKPYSSPLQVDTLAAIQEKLASLLHKMTLLKVYGKNHHNFTQLQKQIEQKLLDALDQRIPSNERDMNVSLRDLVELRDQIQHLSIDHFLDLKDSLLTRITSLLSQIQTPQIKRTLLELAPQYPRLEIAELGEICGIQDLEILSHVIQDLIETGEIQARYFISTQTIVFTQHVSAEDLADLDNLFKQWDEPSQEKKR